MDFQGGTGTLAGSEGLECYTMDPGDCPLTRRPEKRSQPKKKCPPDQKPTVKRQRNTF